MAQLASVQGWGSCGRGLARNAIQGIPPPAILTSFKRNSLVEFFETHQALVVGREANTPSAT